MKKLINDPPVAVDEMLNRLTVSTRA